MLALHARYRGKEKRRAQLVSRSAEALSTLDGVGTFEVLGVEDICAPIQSPRAVCDAVMALLSDGSWAIGIGVAPTTERAAAAATSVCGARAATVRAKVVGIASATDYGEDIAAVFSLLGHVLSKRTLEGREATSLVRSGLNQNEAAEQLGISKQAMSQRLQAAGWHAETAGWQLAVNLLARADGFTQPQPQPTSHR